MGTDPHEEGGMSPKEKRAKPVAVYTRVSSQGDRSDEALLSHDIQREKIAAYLDAKDIPASDEVFTDNDRSGGKMSRPAFDRAVQGVREGRLGGIAVYHLSRFGRTTVGVLELVHEFEERGAAVICLTPHIDTASPEGRAMLTVFLAFYTLEREQAVVKSRDLAEFKLAEGTSLGGWAPVGYSFEVVGQDSNGKDRLGWLRPNEDEPVVREAFERFAAGASPGRVADFLNEAGVRTSRGNPWRATNVREFLTREVYVGVRTYGEKRIEGAHEAIVPPALWRRVQKRLAPKEGHVVVRTRGDGHVLGEGLVRCEVCGSGMVKGNNSKRDTLRCLGRGGGHPVIVYSKALEWIMLEAARYIGPRKKDDGNEAALAEAEARLADAREALAEYAAQGGIEPGEVPAKSPLRLAVVEAEDALAALDRPDETFSLANILTPLGVKLHIESLSIPEQRRVLRSVISKVVLHKPEDGHSSREPLWASQRGEVRDRLTVYFVDGSVSPAEGWPTGAVPALEEMEGSDDPFFQHVAAAQRESGLPVSQNQ
jgi:site-specific DNA recombinase